MENNAAISIREADLLIKMPESNKLDVKEDF